MSTAPEAVAPTGPAAAPERQQTLRDEYKDLLGLTRAYIELIKYVYSQGPGGSANFTYQNGTEIDIGRRELKTYGSVLFAELDKIGRELNNIRRVKKARRARRPVTNKLTGPGYISDQLRDFLVAFLSSGRQIPYTEHLQEIVETKTGKQRKRLIPDKDANGQTRQNLFDPRLLIGLLQNNISARMINIELFTIYTYVEQTKSVSNAQRSHITPLMEQFFGPGTNTIWTVGGTRLTDPNNPVAPASVPADKTAKYTEEVKQQGKSALERIYERNTVPVLTEDGQDTGRRDFPTKRNGTQYIPYIRSQQEAQELRRRFPPRGDETPLVKGDDDWGIVFAMFMVLTSYFFIPDYAFGPQNANALNQLKDPAVVDQLAQVQVVLKNIGQTFRDMGGKKTKSRAAAANRAVGGR